jgi:hypothetical protein
MKKNYYLQKDNGYYTHSIIDQNLEYGGEISIPVNNILSININTSQSFKITENYDLYSIISGACEAGTILKLIFQERITIKHNALISGQNILLERKIDYKTNKEDVIYLKLDENQIYWQEINHLTLLLPAENIYLFPYGKLEEKEGDPMSSLVLLSKPYYVSHSKGWRTRT